MLLRCSSTQTTMWITSRLPPLPAINVLAVDIEGAEGMVFMPEADTRWIQDARLVSLEIHDYFHK